MWSRCTGLCLTIIFGFALNVGCQSMGAGSAVSLSNVFRNVNPSVVMIVATQRSDNPGNPNPNSAVCAGVIISKEGRIITAAHSVDVADQIVVYFIDGQAEKARIVASSAESDISLLQLESVPDNIKVASLGDSDKAQVGDQVLVIGAPYGIDHTLSVGHISGRRRSNTVCHQLTPFEFIQTDAAINQGNSGGPMFDIHGNVIGIVSRILSSSGGSEGLGFAVSINTAKGLLLNKKTFWIGFNGFLLYGNMAKAFNLPQDAGLLIQSVADNSPGDTLGLRAGNIPMEYGNQTFLIGGDVVLSIQGYPVTHSVGDVCAIQDVVGGFTGETEIVMTVLREGKIVELTNRN